MTYQTNLIMKLLQMMPKLSKRQTGSGKRRDMLKDIAADCGITLCVEDETCHVSQSKTQVNSENECSKGIFLTIFNGNH